MRNICLSQIATIIFVKEIFPHTFEIQVKIQVFLKSLDYCVMYIYSKIKT